MAIITHLDFTGKYVVAKNGIQTPQITETIADNEMKFLSMVLGVELAKLYVADLDENGVLVSERFQAITDPFQVQESEMLSCRNSSILSSVGIKRMLLGFIYFVIVNDKRTAPSFMGGNTKPVTENSEQIIDLKMFDYHNEAVNSSRAIQEYIYQNRSEYPEYKGQLIRYNSPF